MEKSELIERLEQGYHERDDLNKDMGYFREFVNRFSFKEDFVELLKTTSYDGEEDMSNEWLNTSWNCRIPRKAIDDLILQLEQKSTATINISGTVHEEGWGRRPYGLPTSTSKTYDSEITVTLELERDKLKIILKNPQEMITPDDL